jgi:hypothetical protein
LTFSSFLSFFSPSLFSPTSSSISLVIRLAMSPGES